MLKVQRLKLRQLPKALLPEIILAAATIPQHYLAITTLRADRFVNDDVTLTAYEYTKFYYQLHRNIQSTSIWLNNLVGDHRICSIHQLVRNCKGGYHSMDCKVHFSRRVQK